MSVNSEELERDAFKYPSVSPADDYTPPEIKRTEGWRPRYPWLAVDALCLLAIGLSCLLFKLVGVPYRRGFYCDDDSINKPYKKSTVPSSVMYPVGFALAYSVFFVTELYRFRLSKQSESFEGVCLCKLGPFKLNSLHITLWNLFVSFAFGALSTILLTDVGKYTIGRLRPHFLSICQPNPAVLANCTHKYIMGDICTGDPAFLREGRLSFPSGHASFSGGLLTKEGCKYCQDDKRANYSHKIAHLIFIM